MSYKPDPAKDPDWWTVTQNGEPVWFFPPDRRDLAIRFATDPAIASSSPTRRWRE